MSPVSFFKETSHETLFTKVVFDNFDVDSHN